MPDQEISLEEWLELVGDIEDTWPIEAAEQDRCLALVFDCMAQGNIVTEVELGVLQRHFDLDIDRQGTPVDTTVMSARLEYDILDRAVEKIKAHLGVAPSI